MMQNRIKKLTSIAETKFLSLYNAEYINKKGKKRNWIIASRKDFNTLNSQYFDGMEINSDAVIMAAFHEESQKIVCVKQFRVPLNDYVYELPAGLIDGDESVDATAMRELKEETGLDLISVNHKKSKNGVFASAGMTDESAAIVFCSCKGNLSKQYLEEDEDIETILLSKEEAKELLAQDVKFDMRAFLLLHAFSQLGKQLFE